ncbi:DNA-J related domain-containing protein [Vibrio caribbeanicus]|uniref:DnaJ family protein n=1 Tax=Vibrio caribbeanicus ATCC BAA-2122 TaxID=796620 RepID=E3BKA9_9VIBR|nr:DNA-J related domain-containing protein [Vibrio caribbeanicus]EFP96494.1 DnaJ family protein [Vibrio caribbeanicus ATCC BAA-2122]
MEERYELIEQFQQYMENPLLWPILEVLRKQSSGWKVHTLSAHLSELGFMPVLDEKPEKDLFKRNFLIMNALYQLQETLYPDHWLQVQAMDIILMSTHQSMGHEVDQQDPLRDYYIHWKNYDAEEGEVKRLLNEFWTRYKEFVGSTNGNDMDRSKALSLFELPLDATQTEIRKTWRKLALKWHPDRECGDSEQFRVLCEAWHVLRHEVHA